MNRTKLKNYAPQARKDFIQAVTAKAAQYGLTAAKIEPMTEKGDVVLISGNPFPKAVGDKRKRLEDRIKKNGFEYTMEAMAYTWFNRLVAVRYMEFHGYLEHGFRVLSHPEGYAQPEILEKAQYVDLPGLNQKKVIELKLDGTKEEELYRLLLTAQFNALSKAMPFLFEKIDDETELLLPDSLLNSDSLIRKLVTEIDEEDWKEVEIIGWLYQFYISDKKDEVIGKVVKSEDIPAATQLFTPNWIVKYLVQNTIGRQWLATYPQSSLRSKMEYYIEPAEQTPEVQEQLRAITPTSLNPEELTLLDPACGSGHILVEAYDLFKAIYEERGYRSKDIPALILQKNLFGLEIDDRAAQLAAFALMMKARADYPRIFDSEAQPNVVSFVESKGLDAEEIHYALMSPLPSEKQTIEPPRPDGLLFETENNLFTHAAEAKATQTVASRTLPDITKEDIAELVALFENAKTFGSLIQVPSKLAEKLPLVQKRLDDVLAHGDLTHGAARIIGPMLSQAQLLARRYKAVVANPPYMGARYYAETLKLFVAKWYENAKADLYACFMQQNLALAEQNGFVGMITIPNWMFLSSFDAIRHRIITQNTIDTLIHNGRGVFGSDFGSCAFVIRNSTLLSYLGCYRRLFDRQGSVSSNDELEETFFRSSQFYSASARFIKIPGVPIAYWASPSAIQSFERFPSLFDFARPRQGLATTKDSLFLRLWHEVSSNKFVKPESTTKETRTKGKWFAFNKGGSFRKWYGNAEYVVNYENDGQTMCDFIDNTPGCKVKSNGRVINRSKYFCEGVTWSSVSIGKFSMRFSPSGFIFGHKGPMCFAESSGDLFTVLALGCSPVFDYFLQFLSPSVDYSQGPLGKLPVATAVSESIAKAVNSCISLAKADWDASELSWDFQSHSIVRQAERTLEASYTKWLSENQHAIEQMQDNEQQINRILIDAYGLCAELTAKVPLEQISLSVNPSYRFGSSVCVAEEWQRFRHETVEDLISYAIGCAMGRYSLDKPGLIYAQSGNEGFDPTQYTTFRADDDGIIPLLEADWGILDDAAHRIFEFVSVAWHKKHLDENLNFIADSLTPSNGEQPKDTIRRYLATGFYKHHLSMYKKRPIYWMFSSGKQRAFQCLVYLHRYNEGTLARMRTEYVIPLMGKMTARLEHLQGPPEQKGTGGEIAATSAVTVKRKLEKERDNIRKQLAELQAFDEKLRHYADRRIKLDLDDGVKVNYGKFSDPEIGDILAEVKAICGNKDED